jgi:hypothetical protein
MYRLRRNGGWLRKRVGRRAALGRDTGATTAATTHKHAAKMSFFMLGFYAPYARGGAGCVDVVLVEHRTKAESVAIRKKLFIAITSLGPSTRCTQRSGA